MKFSRIYQIKKKGPFSCIKILLLLGSVFIFTFAIFLLFASQSEEVKAQGQPQVKVFLSPATGSFLVDSTFEASIIIDTGGISINAARVDLSFPADKFQIVSPSSGLSFISLWVEQPTYSNTEGTISFSGVILGGINTSSGVVSTITFRVKKPGEAIIKILPTSSVLANDGKGTETLSKIINGRYILKPKSPEGPRVFSETHPDETVWYNNNNPIISWEKETGVTDFSFVLDSYPQTVPDNTPDTQETTKAFENLADGLWYFHIKAEKENIWGMPSHFLVRIDASPPASFRPKVEFLLAAIVGRAFVSFFTTDALSGVDYYGVAVIDKTKPPTESPVFIETTSPYQLPRFISGNLRVMIRATDKAGNARDEYADANFPESFISIIKNNIRFVLLGILVFIVLCLVIYFLFVSGRRFISYLRKRNIKSKINLLAK